MAILPIALIPSTADAVSVPDGSIWQKGPGGNSSYGIAGGTEGTQFTSIATTWVTSDQTSNDDQTNMTAVDADGNLWYERDNFWEKVRTGTCSQTVKRVVSNSGSITFLNDEGVLFSDQGCSPISMGTTDGGTVALADAFGYKGSTVRAGSFTGVDRQGTPYIYTARTGMWEKQDGWPALKRIIYTQYGVMGLGVDGTIYLQGQDISGGLKFSYITVNNFLIPSAITQDGELRVFKASAWSPNYTPFTEKVKAYEPSLNRNPDAYLTGDPMTSVSYTLTFDLNGAPSTAPSSQSVDSTQTTSKPADPTWDGHRFMGWYTAADGGSEFTFGQTLTADTTVYAHWEIDAGTTIACAPQTGDPAASVWQHASILLGLLMFSLAAYLLVLQRRLRGRRM